MKLTAESTVINDDKLNTNIDSAQSTADAAKSVADNTAQYFWFTSSGSDTGAHISEKTQAQFISSPSGSNVLARSSGIAIRDGLQELATFTTNGVNMFNNGNAIAKFGSTIELSDGSKTVYEVKQSSTTVKVLRTYNASFVNGDSTLQDEIAIGRTASSWSINLTYKVNNGSSITKNYTSISVLDNTDKYYLSLGLLSGNIVRIGYGRGNSASSSETITIVSVELNFVTAQQVVESTIGAYADKSMSGAFRIGNGVSSTSPSNVMLVDWGGNLFLKSDIYTNCGSDSSGGVSLSKPRIVFAYNSGSSDPYYSVTAYQVGKVVTLQIQFTKSTSTFAGSNILDVAITGVPEPISNYVTGMTYYGNHAIALYLYTDGSNQVHLKIVNSSPSAVTASDDTYGTITYICK